MRPIDADAIAHKLEGKFNQDMVRYAPTLDYKDLIPQGEWIVEKIVGRKRTVRRICSLCGYDNLNRKSNFCPNCGARMKGGE